MTTLLAVLAVLPALAGDEWTPPTGAVRLDKLQRSREHGVKFQDRLFTVADQSFSYRIEHYGLIYQKPPATLSLLIGGTHTSLEAWVGVPDGNSKAGSVEVLLDGVSYSTTMSEAGERATKLSVPLTGIKTLTLKISANIALIEPYLTKGAPKPPSTKASLPNPSPAGNRPSLLTPSEGAVLAGEVATLKWKAVDNAVSYSVVLVCAKLLGPVPVPDVRTWTWTVSNPSCTVPIKDLPAGEYLWSVVAFGKEKPLGGYSAERLFKIER